jgi:hypothetical protein
MMSTMATKVTDETATEGDGAAGGGLSDALSDTLVDSLSSPSEGTISQPSGKVDRAHAKLCSLYAPANAIQVAEGADFTPDKEAILRSIIEKNKARDGGNPMKLYQSYYKEVYGLRATNMSLKSSQKRSWKAAFSVADREDLPMAIAVQWQKGKSKGNHWVYSAGLAGDVVQARDQQNGNLLIDIDTSKWTGTASGGWSYKVTELGLGVTADKYSDVSSELAG